MNFLEEKLQGVLQTKSVHLDCFDCEVEIKKVKVSDLKYIKKLEDENKQKAVHFLMSNFLLKDGMTLAGPDDYALVGEIPLDAMKEIFTKFMEVNDIDPDEIKKKVKS